MASRVLYAKALEIFGVLEGQRARDLGCALCLWNASSTIHSRNPRERLRSSFGPLQRYHCHCFQASDI